MKQTRTSGYVNELRCLQLYLIRVKALFPLFPCQFPSCGSYGSLPYCTKHASAELENLYSTLNPILRTFLLLHQWDLIHMVHESFLPSTKIASGYVCIIQFFEAQSFFQWSCVVLVGDFLKESKWNPKRNKMEQLRGNALQFNNAAHSKTSWILYLSTNQLYKMKV